MKQKTFSITFKGLSLDKNFLRPESPPSRNNQVEADTRARFHIRNISIQHNEPLHIAIRTPDTDAFVLRLLSRRILNRRKSELYVSMQF